MDTKCGKGGNIRTRKGEPKSSRMDNGASVFSPINSPPLNWWWWWSVWKVSAFKFWAKYEPSHGVSEVEDSGPAREERTAVLAAALHQHNKPANKWPQCVYGLCTNDLLCKKGILTCFAIYFSCGVGGKVFVAHYNWKYKRKGIMGKVVPA